MRRLLSVVLAVGLIAAEGSAAQDIDRYLSLPLAPISAVINYQQLFDQTEFGVRFRGELQDARLALQRENQWYSERFEQEEARIVELRKQDDQGEYNEASDAFHRDVTNRRSIQDQKGARLEEWGRVQENLFRDVASRPIVQLAETRGISIILPAESLIWYAAGVDLTRDALLAINDGVGDGTGLEGYITAVEYVGIEPVE
ncbi:MAG: hypothetical protein OXC91_09630 [Rhodobacteraceae bacterium]|nr:hypothetical protein [Paracoccaceae bacterium]